MKSIFFILFFSFVLSGCSVSQCQSIADKLDAISGISTKEKIKNEKTITEDRSLCRCQVFQVQSNEIKKEGKI
nr:hypothetical protein 22 [bacterium]